MAEFFTLRRRMALLSIVLLLTFVGGLIAAPVEVISESDFGASNQRVDGMIIALIFVGASVGAWLHWHRFAVPITVAAGGATVAASVIGLVVAAIAPQSSDAVETVLLPLVFVAGIAVFAFAMRWGISDRARQTRRSDVAFWLHLVAAPMIAHPLFHWLGTTDGRNIGAGAAVSVLLCI